MARRRVGDAAATSPEQQEPLKRRCVDPPPAEKSLLDYEEYLRYYGMSCSMTAGSEEYSTAWELFGANQNCGPDGPVQEPAEAVSAALSAISAGSARESPRSPGSRHEEEAAGETAAPEGQPLGVSLAAELEAAALAQLESVADDESVAPTCATPASRDLGDELGENAWAKVEPVHKWELATARSAHEAHRAIVAAHWASAAQQDGAGEKPLSEADAMDGDWTLA